MTRDHTGEIRRTTHAGDSTGTDIEANEEVRSGETVDDIGGGPREGEMRAETEQGAAEMDGSDLSGREGGRRGEIEAGGESVPLETEDVESGVGRIGQGDGGDQRVEVQDENEDEHLERSGEFETGGGDGGGGFGE